MTDTELYDVGGTAATVAPVRAVRGSVLFAGWKALRARGLYARYLDLLPASYRAAVDDVSTADWAPLPLVEAHERALDDLHLDRAEARSIGLEMSHTLNGIVYATLARLAGSLGASPWMILSQANKTWRRAYDGGAVVVFKQAETSARIEVWGDPLAGHLLHREALGGALVHALEKVRSDAVVQEVPERRGVDTLAYFAHW